jgi:hypothetical protein
MSTDPTPNTPEAPQEGLVERLRDYQAILASDPDMIESDMGSANLWCKQEEARAHLALELPALLAALTPPSSPASDRLCFLIHETRVAATGTLLTGQERLILQELCNLAELLSSPASAEAGEPEMCWACDEDGAPCGEEAGVRDVGRDARCAKHSERAAVGEIVERDKAIANLRRALVWHGDPARMATTREAWQQDVDEAICWVRDHPEDGYPARPTFTETSTSSPSPSPALRVAAEALEEARLIVANLPHEESLFLAKIDTALATIRAEQGDAR